MKGERAFQRAHFGLARPKKEKLFNGNDARVPKCKFAVNWTPLRIRSQIRTWNAGDSRDDRTVAVEVIRDVAEFRVSMEVQNLGSQRLQERVSQSSVND